MSHKDFNCISLILGMSVFNNTESYITQKKHTFRCVRMTFDFINKEEEDESTSKPVQMLLYNKEGAINARITDGTDKSTTYSEAEKIKWSKSKEIYETVPDDRS